MPLPETETLVATKPRSVINRTRLGVPRSRFRSLAVLGHVLVGTWATIAAVATGYQLNSAQYLEQQLQSLFFEIRGPVKPPQDIIILAMDTDTIAKGQDYELDPAALPFFESLQKAPPKRTAYAIAIQRLMSAGAKSVAIDVVFDAPGAHGEADDRRLQKALRQYPGRITLAVQYDDQVPESATYQAVEVARQRDMTKLLLPNRLFQTSPSSVGFINLPVAVNGQFRGLGSQFQQQLVLNHAIGDQSVQQGIQEALQEMAVPSFAEAALQAAGKTVSPPRGQEMFFYGPVGTFQRVPLWQVLDPENWKVHLEQGTFRNKIVLIGPTAPIYRDFHATPFAGSWLYPNPIPGVEVHATAIATLIENRSIAAVFPFPWQQGGFVLVTVLAVGYLQSRPRRSLFRLGLAIGLMVGIGIVGYVTFVYGLLTLPIAVPMGAIVLSGVTYIATASAKELWERNQLRQILERQVEEASQGSTLVSEIASKIDSFQDLLKLEQKLAGTKLKGRYKIVKVLGSGGFGETYVAEDLDLPANPACVVKLLKPASKNIKLLKLAQRLFKREAEALERLGKHEQIPELMAYFEENEKFYLVQEYIIGESLSSRLGLGKILPESQVTFLLQELLKILEFVHSEHVIHRDIKPSNIILRAADGKPVLIDFGAVKDIRQLSEESGQTIGIGTKGYMPVEQQMGEPRPCSDIYAVGMIGIQALTGLPPNELPTVQSDAKMYEIGWRSKAPQVSHALAKVLSKMVCPYYPDRYQTATEALQALQQVAIASTGVVPRFDVVMPENHLETDQDASDSGTSAAAPTRIWTCGSLPETDSLPETARADLTQSE